MIASIQPPFKARTKDELVRRVAADIPDGAYMNLGIGQPTRVADFVQAGKDVILHSENGILGMGAAPGRGSRTTT